MIGGMDYFQYKSKYGRQWRILGEGGITKKLLGFS